MSKTHTIITIGRQFGSGGREIGKRLADELGIEVQYDEKNGTAITKQVFGTVRYAKSFLRHMMKNRRTVFSIHW